MSDNILFTCDTYVMLSGKKMFCTVTSGFLFIDVTPDTVSNVLNSFVTPHIGTFEYGFL